MQIWNKFVSLFSSPKSQMFQPDTVRTVGLPSTQSGRRHVASPRRSHRSQVSSRPAITCRRGSERWRGKMRQLLFVRVGDSCMIWCVNPTSILAAEKLTDPLRRVPCRPTRILSILTANSTVISRILNPLSPNSDSCLQILVSEFYYIFLILSSGVIE